MYSLTIERLSLIGRFLLPYRSELLNMEAGKEADLWFHIQVLHVIAEKYKDEKLALLYIKDVVLRDSPHTIYPISEKITDVANEFCEACKKEIKEEKEE